MQGYLLESVVVALNFLDQRNQKWIDELDLVHATSSCAIRVYESCSSKIRG